MRAPLLNEVEHQLLRRCQFGSHAKQLYSSVPPVQTQGRFFSDFNSEFAKSHPKTYSTDTEMAIKIC
jgi:hypothetical protein